MVLADVAGNERAAFVDRASEYCVTANADARTARRFLCQILPCHLFVHIFTLTGNGMLARSATVLLVAALYERRIIFLSEISSDGHRPPLQKNANNCLSIFVLVRMRQRFACGIAADSATA